MPTATIPVNTLPGATATFLPALQEYLRDEPGDQRAEMGLHNVVISGGIHATAASLTSPALTCVAYPGGHRVSQTSTTLTYLSNRTSWVIVHQDTTGTVGTFTRVAGTHFLIDSASGATRPALPPNAAWLMAVVTDGTAITTVTDLRNTGILGAHSAELYASLNDAATVFSTDIRTIRISHSVPLVSNLTIPATMMIEVTPQGRIDLNGYTLTMNGAFRAARHPVFSETGSVVFGPATAIDPVWFARSGSGTAASPWISTDGTGGLKRAIAALSENGRLVSPSGEFSWTATTTASNDHDNIVIDLGDSRILTANTGLHVEFNTLADPANSAPVVHTITVRGGYWDTGTESSTVQGQGFRARRCRNVLFERIRFRGIATPITAPVADTMIIRHCYFRRYNTAINIEDWMTTGVPQDIWIVNNGGSANTTEPIFVNCATRVDNLHILHNAVAQNTSSVNTRFFALSTGNVTGVTSNVFVEGNATEQSTSATLVKVTRYGTSNMKNLAIRNNEWGSSSATYLDIAYIEGFLIIEGNSFISAAATAIKVDNMRNGCKGYIRGNEFLQTGTSSGVLFAITNVLEHSLLVIGHNGEEDFYTGDPGTKTYSGVAAGRIMFEPRHRTQTSAVASGATIAIDPHDVFIALSGSSTINTITQTYAGHSVKFRINTTAAMADGAGNLKLAGAFTGTADDMIQLISDGTNWLEVSRSAN